MHSKYLVLGYFGYHTNQLDGQTVKTRDIYRLLKMQFNDSEVRYFDTQSFKKNKVLVFKMIFMVCRCNRLVYLPANNNLKYIFPVIYILSIIFKFKIDYFVVGGWLGHFLKRQPIQRWMLKRINGIHVETNRLFKELKTKYNFTNIDIFPNFRFFEFDTYASTKHQESDILKVCFISRVNKEKGLDIIKQLSEILKKSIYQDKIIFDFYGQKTDSYFDEYLSNIKNIYYKGILSPERVIERLKQYDLLIFPTHYEGEGCPGILIESLFAGLPIIASNWKDNGEFVIDNKNGFLCETYNANSYFIALQKFFNRRYLLEQFGNESLNMSREYSHEYAASLIQKILD